MQNTWLSKIFLNGFVGRQVLGQSIRKLTNEQCPQRSLCYPRGVTATVWLREPPVG